MVTSLSSFSSCIIELSIFIGIVQMILPQGKLKKHILFVCLIMITLTILDPLLKILNDGIDISSIYDANIEKLEIKAAKIDFENNYRQMLYDAFEDNVEQDILERLQKMGYVVHSISCEIDKDTFEPKFLRIELESQDGFVQPVRIEVMDNYLKSDELSKIQEYEIKAFLKENYGVNENSIVLNGRE